ncbi:MAG: hypothetical protein QW728_03640, partial [Thermoplasmata archaeon]
MAGKNRKVKHSTTTGMQSPESTARLKEKTGEASSLAVSKSKERKDIVKKSDEIRKKKDSTESTEDRTEKGARDISTEATFLIENQDFSDGKNETGYESTSQLHQAVPESENAAFSYNEDDIVIDIANPAETGSGEVGQSGETAETQDEDALRDDGEHEVDALLKDVERRNAEKKRKTVITIIAAVIGVVLVLGSVLGYLALVPKINDIVITASPAPMSGNLIITILAQTRAAQYSGDAVVRMVYAVSGDTTYEVERRMVNNELILTVPYSEFVVGNGNYKIVVSTGGFEKEYIHPSPISVCAGRIDIQFEIIQNSSGPYSHQIWGTFLAADEQVYISGNVSVVMYKDGVLEGVENKTIFQNNGFIIKRPAVAGNYTLKVKLTNNFTREDSPYHYVYTNYSKPMFAPPVANAVAIPPEVH